MPEAACSRRIEVLGAKLSEFGHRRQELIEAIEAEPEPDPGEHLVEAWASIRETIERGSPEQRKALAQAFVAKIMVEGRSAIHPPFWVPCAKVRKLSRVVLPALRNQNLSALVKTAEIELSSRHTRVRRAGYRL